VSDAPARRQATLTIGSILLCVLDLLLAPNFLLMAGFAGDAPHPSAAMEAVIVALVASAAASVACAVIAFVAGLLGAPRRLVFWVALFPVLILAGFIGLLVVAGDHS
jgi:hypothetical protein